MPRTSADAVKAVLLRQYDFNNLPDIGPFITTASALVDWVVGKNNYGELNGNIQERIECFLAAHFYFHADQVLQSKSTGGASGSFQGRTDMVFMGSQYGQTACALDVTGQLAKRSKEAETGMKRTTQFFWMGKPPANQIPARDRGY
jgi:hypothetical protein